MALPERQDEAVLGRLERLVAQRRASIDVSPFASAPTMAPEPAFLPSPRPGQDPAASMGRAGTVASPAPVRSTGDDARFVPGMPTTLEQTGLAQPLIEDHIIRTLYFQQALTAVEIGQEIALSYQVVGPLVKELSAQHFLEVKGQRGMGDSGYVYALVGKGKERAEEALAKTQYQGPLPVPLSDYCRAIESQSVRSVSVTVQNIRDAFRDLTVKQELLDQLGPAVNSGSSLFIFGAPGNGKTALAERITRLMGDRIYLPYAVEVDGWVIKVFDALNHEPVADPFEQRRDPRWVLVKRPVVVAGGELTLAGLDLLWSDVGRFYEAPLQMKANGGVFFVDDFGRQLVRPSDLLNRWIVPLEKRLDYLNLATGKKLAIPFDQLLIFSTNLKPEDLVDEAFLRRIKFKIRVDDPEPAMFEEVFRLACAGRGIAFDEWSYREMLQRWWSPSKRPLRMCQPRDVLDQLQAVAQYLMVPPAMTRDMLDRACRGYFGNL
ncbi:MAG: ATP-binding protein [Chloroflexi bacterium]|nr:ATP-binding protein [Chloroflexota bacterium]